MTVTNTLLETNTRQIVITAENDPAVIRAAVNTAITSMGWAQHDTVAAVDGTDDRTTFVYSALNMDGVTSKFMILRWSTLKNNIDISACESWNTTTKVATNEVYRYSGAGDIPWKCHNTDIIIMATARWCVFTSFISSEPSVTTGVIEVEREAPEDTAAAGFPCFGWFSSGVPLGTGQGVTGGSAPSAVNYPWISYPRTRNGSTGFAAATNWIPTTQYASYQNTNLPYQLGTLGLQRQLHGWDSTMKLIHTVRPHHGVNTNTYTNYGRMCGLKTVQRIGEIMNKVNLPVDANGFYSVEGVSTPHWVLNYNARFKAASANWGSALSITTIALGTTVSEGQVVATGAAYYITTGNQQLGVVIVDAISLAVTRITEATIAGTSRDIKYDGYRYVYVATSSGIYAIDTQNANAVTSDTTVAGGFWSIGVYSDRICAGRATAALTPLVHFFSPTLTALNVGAGVAAVATARVTAQSVSSLTVDHAGTFYSICTNLVTASDIAVGKLLRTFATATQVLPSSPGIACSSGIIFIDGHLYISNFLPASPVYLHTIIASTFSSLTLQVSVATSATTAGVDHRAASIYTGGLIVWSAKTAANSVGTAYHSTLGTGSGTAVAGLAGSAWGTNANGATGTDGVRLLSLQSANLVVVTGLQGKAVDGTGTSLGQWLMPV